MYIVIIFAGIPVTILYNLTSAIIRAMGDSKTPVYFLVMSALLNIVLDLFCILVLKMGVAGAALATVISQAISGICCLIYMIRKYEILRMQGTEGKADLELMLRLTGMGVPMGLQYSVTDVYKRQVPVTALRGGEKLIFFDSAKWILDAVYNF